jgi:hypothetical protein
MQSLKPISMNKNLRVVFLSSMLCFTSVSMKAQWCVPTTIIPYAPSMPGITHVVIGTIDRTSSDLENYPNNSYVNTGLSTDLEIGNTYSVSITHTIDGTICPDMNLRVWVDYNLDYSLEDAGETVISVNHHAPGTYTGTFTVPATAVPGTTRMRITAKMSDIGGHTLPTPCDMPNPDPLGYHGETEDYSVNIINATGIHNAPSSYSALSVFPTVITDHVTISIPSTEVTYIKISNAIGEIVWTKEQDAYAKDILLEEDVLGNFHSGIYFVEVTSASTKAAKKIVVSK